VYFCAVPGEVAVAIGAGSGVGASVDAQGELWVAAAADSVDPVPDPSPSSTEAVVGVVDAAGADVGGCCVSASSRGTVRSLKQ
jgi:hypothetical protein